MNEKKRLQLLTELCDGESRSLIRLIRTNQTHHPHRGDVYRRNFDGTLLHKVSV